MAIASPAAGSKRPMPSPCGSISGRWNDRGGRAQSERYVAVARRIDLPLHVGLLWHMRPIRHHGHDAVEPNADENVRLIANLFTHGLPLSSVGSSVPRAGNSSPSRPHRPKAALREPAPDISR